jgi:predicted glycosyltransferase
MPLKILIYAQDKRGLGHVRRALLIARALLEARSDAAVLLATKSTWPASVQLGRRFDFLKLPAELTLGAATDHERDAEREAIHALRRDLLRDAVFRLEPALVLADTEPLGKDGELAPALSGSGAKLVYGMRDVLDQPEGIAARWARDGALDALRDRVSRIVVYGHPELFDSLATYALPEAVRAKATYAGYVCAPPDGTDTTATRAELGVGDEPFVLVTGGGGVDLAPVLCAAIEAHALVRTRPRPRLVLVTGPFMKPGDHERVEELGSAAGHIVRRQIDVMPAMAASSALVTMGGYNTLVEAMVLGRRPVVVPRATHKREQIIRAQAFAAHGLVRCLPPAELTGRVLAAALDAELAEPACIDARAYLDLNGRRTAEALLEVVER